LKALRITVWSNLFVSTSPITSSLVSFIPLASCQAIFAQASSFPTACSLKASSLTIYFHSFSVPITIGLASFIQTSSIGISLLTSFYLNPICSTSIPHSLNHSTASSNPASLSQE
jgi:hypothetical protein